MIRRYPTLPFGSVLLVLGAMACLIGPSIAAQADENGGIPSWQRGVSQWTGQGYTPPTSPAPPVPDSPASASSKPTPTYTIPTPPGSAVSKAGGAFNGASGPVAMVSPALATSEMGVDPTDEIWQVAAQYGVPTPEPYLDGPIIGQDYAGSGQIAPGQITDQVGSGMSGEELPLQREVISWYQYPWRWMSQGWTNHAEFGLDGSDGNATTLAIQTGLELKRKTDAYTLAIDVDYRQASSRSLITEDNARLNIDYDRLLGDTPWSLFGKFGVEYDEFKSFDLRLNLNSGLGYHWIRTDQTTFVTRFGAGASREIGAPNDDWTPEAVFGIEAEHQLNSRNKLKGKVDFFPSWADFSDHRLVTDLGWEVLLSEEDNFSLKLSLTDRYDSTPQGALANDVYYSALLLYKF